MAFSSPRFLLFLALALVPFALVTGRQARKHWLLLASCIFYAAWDWRYLGFLIAIASVGYACATRMDNASSPQSRKPWLIVSVSFSLGLLAFCKYVFFRPALPLGISFYTFNSIACAVDTYRGKARPCPPAADYFLFIMFFPYVIAGPLVRASAIIPQIRGELRLSGERLICGGSLFIQGLTKKLLIADRLGTIASPIFADPGLYSTATVWFALLAYSLQIYCDFSGYSDMAIGTAKMFGIDLPENFHLPYLSSSIADFWQRWHISLSRWFRDYVFLPIAYASGRRLERLRLSARNENLASYAIASTLTMTLCGLWHGAGWGFVAWGALHGCALVAHRLWLKSRKRKSPMPVWLAWPATQLFVMLAWVPFRCDSLQAARTVMLKLFGLAGGGVHWVPEWLFWCLPAVVAGHLIALGANRAKNGQGSVIPRLASGLGWKLEEGGISGSYLRPAKVTIACSYVLAVWLMLIFYFAPTRTSPFIYFSF